MRIAVVTSAGMVVAVASWMLVRSGSPVSPASPPTERASARSAAPEARRRSAPTQPGPRSSQHRIDDDPAPPDADTSVRRAVLGPVEPGESAVSQEWDALTPDARTRALRDDLELALKAIERHGATAQAIAKAESALSDLRAQLYTSERGRAEHQRYEARLDAVQRDSALR